MSTWRVAHALEQLRTEVNARWPNRSKISDGTIGDVRHQHEAGGSDHNPNAAGVVRAFDCTANVGDTNPANVDGAWLAEHVRQLGAAGHPALQNHGYVIWDHRAAYATNGWRWVAYDGVSPHTEHVHISVGRDPAQYDNTTTWAITGPEEDDMTAEQEAKLDRAIAGIARLEKAMGLEAATEAADEKEDDQQYGSVRGWLGAIGAKLGVTRADATAQDPTHKGA